MVRNTEGPNELIERTRDIPMSPERLRAQRSSFAIGDLNIEKFGVGQRTVQSAARQLLNACSEATRKSAENERRRHARPIFDPADVGSRAIVKGQGSERETLGEARLAEPLTQGRCVVDVRRCLSSSLRHKSTVAARRIALARLNAPLLKCCLLATICLGSRLTTRTREVRHANSDSQQCRARRRQRSCAVRR